MDDVRSSIAHLYRRAGFGARPEELDAAVGRGYSGTVEDLLAGLQGPDPAGDRVPVPDLSVPGPEAGGSAGSAAVAARAAVRQQQASELQALQVWWLDRMIATSTPLREKLTLLWHGHFATGFEKVRVAALMFKQNELFRTMGAGNFESLTQAVAKDPAMMLWLDTRFSVVGKPNENFARELMELFTLGIGNYTEDDVKEAARCFTGWGFNARTGAYMFASRRHDFGVKNFLGQSGPFNGEDVVRIVTHHPASYRFVVAKLWSHLAFPVAPDDPIVGSLAVGYGADLDITRLLRAIFLHPQFLSSAARGGLVKQPVEHLVGALRAFGARAVGGARSPSLVGALRQLAQEPFNPPNVGGWPQNEYWLTTASSQARLQLGLALAKGLDLSWLTAVPVGERAGTLAHHLAIDGWGPTTLGALNHVAGEPALLVGLALSAPEYVLN
jgi:uncharacterized protein (DUF1800 family)